MLKKFLFSLFILSGVLGMSAQHVPGSWKIIAMTGDTFEYIQDTPSKVYYLSNGSLYSYDKDSNETMYYTPGTKISDSGIKFLKYNGDKKYLALVYKNGNIDLIYDNGKVVNLPEIKNANLTDVKTVNSLQFGKNRIYVATSFGIVIYDDNDHYVIESGIFNTPVSQLFEMGDFIVAWIMNPAGGYYLSYSPKNDRHNVVDKFKKLDIYAYEGVMPVSDNVYLEINGGNIKKVNVDFNADNKLTFSTLANNTGGNVVNRYKDGYYVAGSDGFYMIDSEGNYSGKVSYPSSFGSQTLSFWKSPAEFWAGNSEGIGCYALADGNTSVKHDKYFPESSKQNRTWYRVNHPDGNAVYFSECGQSDVFPNVNNGYDYLGYPLNHEMYEWNTGNIVNSHVLDSNGELLYGSSGRVLYDQEDPSFMYIASIRDGLYVVKDGKVHYLYDRNNSTLTGEGWTQRAYELAFDRHGNLWVLLWGSATTCLSVIPKATLDIMKSDNPEKASEKVNGKYIHWIQPQYANAVVKLDVKTCISSKKDKGIAAGGGWGSNVVGFDFSNSIENATFQFYNAGFMDQDGTTVSPERIPWMEEDKNGWIWVGTEQGIFIVKDLDQLADKSANYIRCERPKVARNDGTNYADYLLSSDFVMNIAVDSNNRKWIATRTSGLYFVSEDGTEILQEFNKDNSPLVSNVVTMVACDPYGNDVLIGTPEGLFVYSSDSAPAKDDYSEVYAFPNPVRPDYTGWITVNGLMDNSIVKIADAQGHVLWQGTSEGGMIVWDGCDTAGNRVRSGVYMVYASQNQNGTSGAVTKIVVIN